CLQLDIPLVDLSGLPLAAAEAAASGLYTAQALRPFDLSEGPLARAQLLRLAEGDHVVLVTMHHAVSDGWSMGILLREWSVLYGAFFAGRPSPLRELPIQYADYAVWQRRRLFGGALEQELSYWKHRLEGSPPLLMLPLDRPRPAAQ